MEAGEALLDTIHKYNAWDARCPSRRVLDLLADKWSILVLVALASKPQYYSELQRRVSGISHKMLSQTLRVLEQQNLLVRTVHPTVPPRVEYALTPLARTLLPTLHALIDWAETNAAALEGRSG